MATAKQGRPDYWLKAKRHLAKVDTVLGEIIRQYKGETLVSRGSAFFSLARAIVGQQISVKAADAVWRKLEQGLKVAAHPELPVDSSLGGGGPCAGVMASCITPQAVLEASTECLRACGLSGQKVIYMRELSQFFVARPSHDWHRQSDEEVVADLIGIKGIGTWSAEMFLIFHLMRADVFPIADLGLRKAIEKHYNKGRTMPLAKMTRLAERWKPYRTMATWYLWRSLDPVPVEY